MVGFEHSSSGLGPGRAGRETGPGEKPGPRLLSNWGPRGGADQTCRAGLRARLGEGAAPAPSPPPPRSRKQRLSVCSRAVWTMAPEFYPRRREGPLQPQLPSPQSGSCASARTGGVCPGCRPRQCLPPRSRRDPFGDGPVGSWKSWERGLCVSAHLGHPFLSTSLIVFVALTVYQTL